MNISKSDLREIIKEELQYLTEFKEGQKGTFRVHGKVFQTKVFSTDDAANAYMEKNKDWGVIGVEGDENTFPKRKPYRVHVAKMKSHGVNVKQFNKVQKNKKS